LKFTDTVLKFIDYLNCSECLPSTTTHCSTFPDTLARTVSQGRRSRYRK